jgi:hypothetical protein
LRKTESVNGRRSRDPICNRGLGRKIRTDQRDGAVEIPRCHRRFALDTLSFDPDVFATEIQNAGTNRAGKLQYFFRIPRRGNRT